MKLASIVLSGILCLGVTTLMPTLSAYARPSTYNDGVDALTDELWWQIRPEMRDSKIDTGNSLFIREWQAIQRVVRANSRSFSGGYCFDGYSAFFDGNLDRVADAVFYVRYPAFSGQRIRQEEQGAARVWTEIRLRLRNPNGVTSC
ncbi:hypothetical protein [Pseudanabaena sp. 'Roaring Creek']|uniref:hypothetical protein n=1 Tax=Pseudanabaena sp. 'Roaring Creek' TaxID=1681830 RepID=UPI0006D7E7B9|nr:hypothetical protein [Pseudanabaena sp. 'Roaring Creek']